MRKHAVSLIALGCLLGVSAPAFAGGIYKYTEADGTVVYTNVPPPKSAHARRMAGTFQPAPRASDAPEAESAKVVRVSREEYDEYIHKAAHRYRIPEALVWAVMHAESGFNPNAISAVGASGLMQLMPATASEMYVKDIFDVRDNIEGGTRYLRVLANEFEGDMVKIVAAYNAGPDAVRKYGGKVPPYAETQAYVRKVIALYFEYKKLRTAKAAQDDDHEVASADAGTQSGN